MLAALNRAEVKRHAGSPPPAVAAVMDPATYAKSVAYTLAKTDFGVIHEIFDTLVLAMVIFGGILPWLFIFVIFYVLMIRPQQRRVKQHQAAIAAVKKGDEIITAGGIRGRVTKIGDDEAEVEIAQGVKVRVIKSTISQVLSPTSAKPAND